MQKTIFGLIVAALLIAGGYYFLSSNPTVAYPQNPREWTDEMRKDHPEEFAQLSEKALKADLATIDERIRGLQESAGNIAKRYDDAQKKFDFGQKHAAELIEAKKAGVFPVEILGTKYEEHQLQSQMKQICGELKVHQRTLDAVKKASKKLEAQKAALANYRVECQGQLDILAVNVELFKANKISTEGLALLSECADVLEGTSSYLADPVVGIEELMKRAENEAEQTAEGDDLDLEAFLNGLGAGAATEVEANDEGEDDFGGLEEFLGKTNDGKGVEESETTVEAKSVEEPAL